MKYNVQITAGFFDWLWRGIATDSQDAINKAKAWAINTPAIPTDFKIGAVFLGQ
jgi:hypothetical protein